MDTSLSSPSMNSTKRVLPLAWCVKISSAPLGWAMSFVSNESRSLLSSLKGVVPCSCLFYTSTLVQSRRIQNKWHFVESVKEWDISRNHRIAILFTRITCRWRFKIFIMLVFLAETTFAPVSLPFRCHWSWI